MNIRKCSLSFLVAVALAACGTSMPALAPSAKTEPLTTPTSPIITVCAPLWTYRDMNVAVLQPSHEAGWRVANIASFRLTSEELGITMKYHDALGDFDKHIEAFRNFIADDEIQAIVLAPFKKTGYEEVLREARDAGKIVVVEGQRIDAPEELYITYVGSDFVEQGRQAGRVMADLLAGSEKKTVVELVDEQDVIIARDRSQGFGEIIEGRRITLTQSQPAVGDTGGGKQAMETFLRESRDIQGVFVHNERTALGAIEAIKEAGLEPAIDIKIVSVIVDGTSYGALVAGELNASVEFSAYLAPQVYEAALDALNGKALT